MDVLVDLFRRKWFFLSFNVAIICVGIDNIISYENYFGISVMELLNNQFVAPDRVYSSDVGFTFFWIILFSFTVLISDDWASRFISSCLYSIDVTILAICGNYAKLEAFDSMPVHDLFTRSLHAGFSIIYAVPSAYIMGDGVKGVGIATNFILALLIIVCVMIGIVAFIKRRWISAICIVLNIGLFWATLYHLSLNRIILCSIISFITYLFLMNNNLAELKESLEDSNFFRAFTEDFDFDIEGFCSIHDIIIFGVLAGIGIYLWLKGYFAGVLDNFIHLFTIDSVQDAAFTSNTKFFFLVAVFLISVAYAIISAFHVTRHALGRINGFITFCFVQIYSCDFLMGFLKDWAGSKAFGDGYEIAADSEYLKAVDEVTTINSAFISGIKRSFDKLITFETTTDNKFLQSFITVFLLIIGVALAVLLIYAAATLTLPLVSTLAVIPSLSLLGFMIYVVSVMLLISAIDAVDTIKIRYLGLIAFYILSVGVASVVIDIVFATINNIFTRADEVEE